MLDFSFQSYIISGTDYNHSHYTDKTKLAFESFDAPVTTYFKYSYYKSANEWEKCSIMVTVCFGALIKALSYW